MIEAGRMIYVTNKIKIIFKIGVNKFISLLMLLTTGREKIIVTTDKPKICSIFDFFWKYLDVKRIEKDAIKLKIKPNFFINKGLIIIKIMNDMLCTSKLESFKFFFLLITDIK